MSLSDRAQMTDWLGLDPPALSHKQLYIEIMMRSGSTKELFFSTWGHIFLRELSEGNIDE